MGSDYCLGQNPVGWSALNIYLRKMKKQLLIDLLESLMVSNPLSPLTKLIFDRMNNSESVLF